MDEDEDVPESSSNPMAALLESARTRAAEFGEDNGHGTDQDEDAIHEDANSISHDTSRKSFGSTFRDVLSSADIVLYVLDARDPASTRSLTIERAIAAADSGSKHLILILNKIDLVPPRVLDAWLRHLRRSHPTLPLRASNSAANARTFDHASLTPKTTTEALLRALKAHAASLKLRRAISVGIVGYPNVGKSSVINALLGRLASSRPGTSTSCPVGAEAGVTTTVRTVKLDNQLTLLDSPGIVFSGNTSSNSSNKSSTTADSETQARLVLLNALPPKQIDDPQPAVSLLLRRLVEVPEGLDKLRAVYDIPPLMPREGDMVMDLLVQVARRRGRLGKGGVPNLRSAAMTVLNDWRDGRIQGWVEAPVLGEEASKDEKEIVSEWGKEFHLDGLWGKKSQGDGEDVADAMEM